jgi:hypothetical protein
VSSRAGKCAKAYQDSKITGSQTRSIPRTIPRPRDGDAIPPSLPQGFRLTYLESPTSTLVALRWFAINFS